MRVLDFGAGPGWALNAGRYRVDIDLVSEHVRWFQANGSRIATVNVTVL